jgi:predicted PurR-regulated permease PerM
MELKSDEWSIYVRISNIILGIVALLFILYIGQNIFIPIVFSVLIAILLNPFVNILIRKKINRIVAITIAVFTAIVVILGLSYFIISQSVILGETLPEFNQKATLLINDGIAWTSEQLNISQFKIEAWLDKTKTEGMDNSTAKIGSALSSGIDFLVLLLLIPVYMFLLLFYKPLLLEFISQIFVNDKKEMVSELLTETKSLIQSYLMGLFFEAVIVAALNTIGLLVIGIKYALLIGVIGAILNLIPYIGGIIAVAIPMLMAVATKSPVSALWVLILYLVVQLIDNNFIIPKIVASKVNINALMSIIVVLIGGAMWGVAGMFLSIPLTAILKVIFDRVDPLKPLGFLIGDKQPET